MRTCHGQFSSFSGCLMDQNDSYLFSSESVGEGHPDKVADSISDSVLDAVLAQDKFSRVACETLVKSDHVVIAGELTTKAKVNYEEVVRAAIREIGYINDDDVFHADKVFITNLLTKQSPDIAQGVDERQVTGKKHAQMGAGDQGIMFGYASNETPELMPAPVMFAHRLNRELARVRKSGARGTEWIRPDCKSQVAVRYINGKLAAIENVVISTQHTADVSHRKIENFCIDQIIKKILPKNLISKQTEFLINPTGRFVVGGPQGDCGLTGRKIIVDSYGGMGRHGGGAFSGKDPTKVDRSAAYMARWVAKHIVASGVAERCELQVAYAIGHPEPTSIHLETFDTNSMEVSRILDAVKKVFRFNPSEIIKQLDLRRPIYRASTHYGHFGKKDSPWEQTKHLGALIKALHAKS